MAPFFAESTQSNSVEAEQHEHGKRPPLLYAYKKVIDRMKFAAYPVATAGGLTTEKNVDKIDTVFVESPILICVPKFRFFPGVPGPAGAGTLKSIWTCGKGCKT